jgi:hypothetical protein
MSKHKAFGKMKTARYDCHALLNRKGDKEMSKQEPRLSRWPFALAILIALLGAALSANIALAALPVEKLLSPEQARPAANVPDCDPNWNVVTSPNVGTGTNFLPGVAAVSSSDVWAVGSYDGYTTTLTLVEHWNGSVWSVVPSPNMETGAVDELRGVAAVSSSDVWAVGDYFDVYFDRTETLMEHWDGSVWSIVPSPNNVGTASNNLYGVAAVSSGDVWAVGDYWNGPSSPFQTLVEHWNGSVWSAVPSPNVGVGLNRLWTVAGVSSSDVWAVGFYENGTTDQTLVEHWNGSVWSVVPSPNVGTGHDGLNGVAAVSANDVWAVGSSGLTLMEHWNGSAWSVVPSPNVGTGYNGPEAVAAVSSSDVWAVGSYFDDAGVAWTLMEHWNGSAWSVVPSSNVGTYGDWPYGVAAVSSSDVWAVGYYYPNVSSVPQTLVERYNPCSGSPTPTTTPGGGATSTPSATRPPTQTPGGPTATPEACTIQFSDVPEGSTFYAFVHCLACRNIIGGYPDGTFKPNNNVTRGQLSKLVSNAAGFNESHTTQSFQDVAVGSTFYDFIARLASRGIISGYPCGGAGEPCVPPANLPYFRPGAQVTRGQTAKIVAVARGLPAPPPGQQTFQDVAVGSTFWAWIESLASVGSIGGYPCGGVGEPCIPLNNLPYFRPGANVTRGQSSKIVSKTFFPNCVTPDRK